MRTEKYSVFVRIKTRIAIYGALFSPYSVVFYAVHGPLLEIRKRREGAYTLQKIFHGTEIFPRTACAVRFFL